jgi:hypothetical protein
MGLKQRSKKIFKGWIPKEFNFPRTVAAQVNQKTNRHNLIIAYVAIFATGFAAAFIITYGILEALSLGHNSYAAAIAAGISAGISITLTVKRNQSLNTTKGRTRQ